jgi:putative spermidine/putrescine transport system permease protein
MSHASAQAAAPVASAPQPRARSRRRRGLSAAEMLHRGYVALFMAFMLAPLVVVIGASFEPKELLRFPPHGWSLRWYQSAVQSAEFVTAARTSVIVAILATLGALVLGVPAAYATARYTFRAKKAVSALLNSPLLVPQLVIGVALLQILAALGVGASVFTLTIGHVLICLPYVVRTIHASILGLDVFIEEAAANLGATRLQIYTTVVLPIIRPALYSAILFAFLISFDNAVISLFLVSARTTTLPIAMYSYVQYNLDPTIAAISTLLVALSVAAMYVASKLAPIDRINP